MPWLEIGCSCTNFEFTCSQPLLRLQLWNVSCSEDVLWFIAIDDRKANLTPISGLFPVGSVLSVVDIIIYLKYTVKEKWMHTCIYENKLCQHPGKWN